MASAEAVDVHQHLWPDVLCRTSSGLIRVTHSTLAHQPPRREEVHEPDPRRPRVRAARGRGASPAGAVAPRGGTRLGPMPPSDQTDPSETEQSLAFADLGIDKRVPRALSDVGYESPSPIQAATIPRAAGRAGTWSARRRPAPARPLPSRCRSCRSIDLKQTDAAGAGAGADPRAGDPGGRGLRALRRAPPRPPRAADLRRPELRRAAVRAAPRRARRGRHPRPGHRPPGEGHARPVASCGSWCSTRPTRCCRWASPTTSRRILTDTPEDTQRRAVLRDHAAAIRRIAKKYLNDAAEITVKTRPSPSPTPASATCRSRTPASSTR